MTDNERELLFALARLVRETAMAPLAQLSAGASATPPGEMKEALLVMQERLTEQISRVDALLGKLGGVSPRELSEELAAAQGGARDALELMLPSMKSSNRESN